MVNAFALDKDRIKTRPVKEPGNAGAGSHTLFGIWKSERGGSQNATAIRGKHILGLDTALRACPWPWQAEGGVGTGRPVPEDPIHQ